VKRPTSRGLLGIAIGLAILSGGVGLPPVSAQSKASTSQSSGPEGVAAKRLEFEVASIKPVDNNGGPISTGPNVYPGGRVVITNLTLKSLICMAFDVGFWQISGGDDWTGKTPYNVEAKAPSSMATRIDLRHTVFGIEDPNLRLMLQSLLIDRFQLKFHVETKTGTVYRLETNGKASPLQPAKTDKLFQAYGEGFSEAMPQGGVWYLDNASMPQVADFLSGFVLHAPVLDKTGLTGTYDFRPESQPDFNQQDLGASPLSNLGEMGLKLQQEKGPVKYFVIDHAEQPSPN
jgi:uncharacterized protein (TIGR03435 family)